jgi:hypothetical protein
VKRRDGLWGRTPWFGITRWVLKTPQERVAHAQSCGDEEKTLGGRQTWDRQVGGGQGHLLHVVPPKKHLRQWSNLGWRAAKGQKKRLLDEKRSHVRRTEHAAKGAGRAGGWGGIGGRQPNKKKSKRPKKTTWGGPGAAAQLSRLESVALFWGCRKGTKRSELAKWMGGTGRGVVEAP